MAKFGNMERDLLSETFDLLEDMNVGNFDWKKLKMFSNMSADDFLSAPMDSFSFRKKPDRERSRTLNSDFFSSSPHFSSSPNFSSTSKTTTETDSGEGFFQRSRFRRSESNYSTSSCDTNSSNETYSDNSDSRRSSVIVDDHKRNTIPTHSRSSSQSSNVDLSKKLENQFLKEERHSMPHEIYSNCDKNLNDLDRPRSVPLNPDDPRNSKSWKDSGSNFKCFPSKVMDSRDLGSFRGHLAQTSTDGGIDSRSTDSMDTVFSDDSRSVYSTNSLAPDSHCSMTNEIEARSRSFPDMLREKYGHDFRRLPPLLGPQAGETGLSFDKRQGRVEDALKWLRSELGLLRAQDKVLLSQLQRCQDTIEDIKRQRRLSESEEEWEDWEIAEFDRREKEASETSQSPNGSFEAPYCEEMEVKRTVKQDVQANI